MEPKGMQNGGKMEPKINSFLKGGKCGLDLLFIIYKPLRDLPKTSLFHLLGRVKTGRAPRAASHATPMLRNGGQGAEKCPEWVPLGSQRTANGLQMSPKCLQQIVNNRSPVPECAPRAPKVSPSLPKPQFLIKILGNTYLYCPCIPPKKNVITNYVIIIPCFL